jgi:purine-nucleoside phosphorylase
LGFIGADIGMSTTPEVIVANQLGLPCAISVITDECDPDNLKPVNIPEIMEAWLDAKLSQLFFETIQKL